MINEGEKLVENAEIELPEKGESGYNFEEIAEIEPAMTSLVKKLKRRIENNKYDVLLSDDIGGRIPTLILKDIFKTVAGKDVKTCFVAMGNYEMLNDHYKLLGYLKKFHLEGKNILISSEFVFSGSTLANIENILKRAGAKKIDFAAATLSSLGKRIYGKKFTKNIISGGRADDIIANFDSKNRGFVGVERNKSYSPLPVLITNYIKKYGRNKEYIFALLDPVIAEEETKTGKYNLFNRKTITDAEFKAIREKIKMAREDVKLMAKRIIENVWGKIIK